MSLPEVALWSVLRTRPNGLKFRRGHPAGPYTLDFYCNAARLAIEADGEAHSRADRPRRDAARDAWLAARGVATLRVRAEDILRDLDAVLTHVVATATARLPLHHSPEEANGPPPRSGED